MSHSHLTLEERIVIELFVHMGLSCRKIATYLDRSHTSVYRELRRNSFPKVATPTRQQSAAPRKDVQCRGYGRKPQWACQKQKGRPHPMTESAFDAFHHGPVSWRRRSEPSGVL